MKSEKPESELSKTQEESDLDEITVINARGGAFDFLNDEPELYSRDDLKK